MTDVGTRDPYDFQVMDGCSIKMFCNVDLDTNRVVYLQAPTGDYASALVEYVKVDEYGPEWPAVHWELRKRARDGEVVVWASKQYEYEGRWVQKGSTRITCETVVEYISGWDEAIRESRDDG